MGSGAGYYYSGLGGEDCYYLVLGDSIKVQRFIDQTVDILQERVSLSTKLMFSSLIVSQIVFLVVNTIAFMKARL